MAVGHWTGSHTQTLFGARYETQTLSFPDPRWQSELLGAGEEKAVYGVIDQDSRVFAVEVIDERTYLNGRFVGGSYFCEAHAPALAGTRFRADALAGLKFSGLIKAREYVHGYDWRGFRVDPRHKSWLDWAATGWLRLFLSGQFVAYQRQYKDVHDGNVMFEIRGPQQGGVPLVCKDGTGHWTLVRVGLQPIDVR